MRAMRLLSLAATPFQVFVNSGIEFKLSLILVIISQYYVRLQIAH